MHGYQRDELVGSLTTTIIHPGDHPLFADFADAIRHGHEFRARRRDVTKDGRVFEVEVRGIQLPLRGRPHMLGVVRDITEQAAAYRLLEERVAAGPASCPGCWPWRGGWPRSSTRQTSSAPSARRQAVCWPGPHSPSGGWSGAAWCRSRPGNAATGSRWPGFRGWPRCSRPGSLSAAAAPKPTAKCTPSSPAPGSSPPGPPGLSSFPWWRRGELMGVLGVTRQEPPRYRPEEVSAAQALASQVAVALGHVALFRRAQAVASAETRQAIARDLHDSVSQTLFSVTLQVRAAQAELRKAGIGEDHPAARALAEVSELNQGALAEMRALIFELRPGALAEEGLVAAVSKHAAAVAAREGIDVDVTGPADRLPLSPEAEEQLYRLTQEALNNVVKHARTTLASVAVTSGPADVSVVVRDDGIGFDPSLGRPGHLGLASMRDRAARLVGRLDIASAPGAGTTITATVPAGVPPEQGGTT